MARVQRAAAARHHHHHDNTAPGQKEAAKQEQPEFLSITSLQSSLTEEQQEKFSCRECCLRGKGGREGGRWLCVRGGWTYM